MSYVRLLKLCALVYLTSSYEVLQKTNTFFHVTLHYEGLYQCYYQRETSPLICKSIDWFLHDYDSNIGRELPKIFEALESLD